MEGQYWLIIRTSVATWLLFYDAMSAVRGSPALHLIYVTYILYVYIIYIIQCHTQLLAQGTPLTLQVRPGEDRSQEVSRRHRHGHITPHSCSNLSAVISLPFSSDFSAVTSLQWSLCSDFSAVISLQSPFCSHLAGCTVIRWYELECECNPTPVDEFYFPGKTLNISISHNLNSNKFSIHI